VSFRCISGILQQTLGQARKILSERECLGLISGKKREMKKEEEYAHRSGKHAFSSENQLIS